FGRVKFTGFSGNLALLLGRAGGELDAAGRALTGRADPGDLDRGAGRGFRHQAGQAVRGADGLAVHRGDDRPGGHARGHGRAAADRADDQRTRADVGDAGRRHQVLVAGVAVLVAVAAEPGPVVLLRLLGLGLRVAVRAPP